MRKNYRIHSNKGYDFNKNRQYKAKEPISHENEAINSQQEYKKSYTLLPSPAMLESYEEIAPGFIDKLNNMIEKEQKHRQKTEIREIKAIANTAKIGYLFVFLIAIAVIYATILLSNKGEATLAYTLCLAGFTFLSITVIASVKFKGFKNKKVLNKSNSNYRDKSKRYHDKNHNNRSAHNHSYGKF